MLRELEDHDVARVEMNPQKFTVEAVDKVDHLLRREQVTIEEDILDIHLHLELLGRRKQLADRLTGTLVADVVGGGIVIGAPRHVYSARYHQQVLGAEIVRGAGHQRSELHAPGAFGRIVAGQGIGPEEERAQAADGDPDLLGHLADRGIVPGAVFRREIIFEVVVELDSIEAGILRQLQAFPQVHPVRVGKGPEVDGFLHLVALRRSPSRIRLLFFRAQAPPGGGCSGHRRRELDGAAAGNSISGGLRGSPWGCQAAHSLFIHPTRRH